MKHVVFKDRVKLYVRAGNGGNGCVSFRREKFIPKGGPDGGDGGNGGTVILRCDANEDSLLPLYYQPHQRAKHAQHGMGSQRHGRNGEDCIAKVPCGTVVNDAETGEFIGELLKDGEELVVAKGGKGGTVKVRRPVVKTVKKPVKCTSCGSWYCPDPACCDTVSNQVLRRATAQGASGEPHIGLIPTMKELAPADN